MNKEIVLTDEFQDSLILILQTAIYYPNDFYENILLKIENLKIFPRMYPKFQINQYRKIPIEKYIILYKIEENRIYITSIIPTKSNRYNKLY